jgi:hypothetical protein
MSLEQFARQMTEDGMSEADMAIGVIWYLDRQQAGSSVTPRRIAEIMRDGGGAMPNVSRLKKRVAEDIRSTKAGDLEFRLNGKNRRELDKLYSAFAGPLQPANSGSVLAIEPFDKARRYTKSVLIQINASYDNALFDCCAVMCRRLFETLIIDSFEKQNCIELIKDKNGEIMMLSGLIQVMNQQNKFRVGRQTKQAAAKLKNIGDWSAHNRTFIAQRSHIDAIGPDLSVATMDLLHLSGQD